MSDLLRAAINVRARCQGLRVALDAAHALDWLDKEIELAKAALAADVRSPPPNDLLTVGRALDSNNSGGARSSPAAVPLTTEGEKS
jgi:hypothetical protein